MLVLQSLLLFVVACTSSVPASPSPAVQTRLSETAVARPQRLADLLNFKQAAEITYRWTGQIPGGGGPGVVIWRRNGTLSRWDTLTTDTKSPEQGEFIVFGLKGGATQSFGCHWNAVSDDRAKVRADCGTDVGAGSIMALELDSAFPLFQDKPVTSVDDRTVLGRRVSCYTGGPVAEICADNQGHILYFAHGSGSKSIVFEATKVIDAIEVFDWPFGSPSSLTPTTSEQVQSADTLQFPSVFHLSPG